MQVESRPFTDEERKALLDARKSAREQGRFDKYFGFFVVWAVLMVIFVFITKFSPAIKHYQFYYMLFAGLTSLYLAYKWHLLTKRAYDANWVDSELKNGMAEVSTFDVTEAVAVEEFEDEGLHYYLDIGEGKVLFLSGQYLYKYKDSKQFPSHRFQIVRTAKTRMVSHLKPLGGYLPPSRTLPAFTKADHENDVVPCDGEILDLDLATLNSNRPSKK